MMFQVITEASVRVVAGRGGDRTSQVRETEILFQKLWELSVAGE